MVEIESEDKRVFGANVGVCKCGHTQEAHGAGWRALLVESDDEEIREGRAKASGIGETECVIIAGGSPSGWLCGCEGYQEIAKVSSAFAFKRGEYADGRNHTLVKGILSLMQAGGIFVWSDLEGPDCDNATEGCENKALPPYPYREDGKWGAGIGQTRIVCRECYSARLAK